VLSCETLINLSLLILMKEILSNIALTVVVKIRNNDRVTQTNSVQKFSIRSSMCPVPLSAKMLLLMLDSYSTIR